MIRRHWSAAGSFTLLLACTSLATAADCRVSAYECAVSHIDQREFEAAVRLLEAELRGSPRDLTILNLLGIALTGAGRADEGNQRFRRALAVDPGFHPARKNLGVNTLAEGRHVEARRLFEEVLADEPDDEIAHVHLAEIHFQADDRSGALAHYERSGRRVTRNPVWLLHYAACLLEADRRPAAIALLDELGETDAEGRFDAGVLLGQSGAYAEAARFFESSRLTARDPFTAGYNQVLMLIEAGEPEAAVDAAEGLVDRAPRPAELHNLLSRAYLGAGRIQDAYDALRQAARLEPLVEEHYIDLALICLDHENFDLGLEIVDIGLRHRPDAPALYLQRGVLLAMKGLTKDAAIEFETAHGLAPDASAPFHALALAWMTMGQADKAVGVLRERAAASQIDAMLPYVLGLALLRTGADPADARGDEAVAAFEAAIGIDPGLTDARTELGKLRLQRGELSEAIAALEHAVALDPGGVTPAYALAQAYRRAGDMQRARALLDRVRRTHSQEQSDDPDRHLKGIVRRIVREETASKPHGGVAEVEPSADVGAARQARALVARGRALEGAGRLDEALGAYQQALRASPGLMEARYGLSAVTAALGDPDGAIRLLREVTHAAPEFSEAHYSLGVNLWRRARADRATSLADLDEAQTALTRALDLDNDQARFHLALGQLLAERQQLAAAVVHLGRAVALAPDDADLAYNLGLALRLDGDLDQAAARFRAALDLDGGHALARRALGLILRQQGDLAGSEAQLRRATADRPDDARGFHLLGAVLLKRDASREAVGHLRTAVRLDPSLTDARVTLAQALARRGEHEAARREQAEVRRIAAERAAFGRTLVLLDVAAAKLDAGDRALALAALREAVSLTPDFAEGHYQLALALREASPVGDDVEAALRRALALDPRHARAHRELGRLLGGRGNVTGALEALGRATALAPSLVSAHRERARIASAAGEWPDATDALEAVVAWEPTSPDARYALAAALEAQGAHAAAARERAIARQLAPVPR